MAAKEKHSLQKLINIKSFVIAITILVVAGTSAYLYWQNNENKRIEELNRKANENKKKVKVIDNEERIENVNIVSKSPTMQNLGVNDPTNTTLENAKILKVISAENKIVVTDKTGESLSLIVTDKSKMQKMVALEGNKKMWKGVKISDVPSSINATIIYNKSNEIVYLVFVASE